MKVQQAIRFWIARRSVMRAILGTKNGVTGWYQDRNSDSVAYCIVELDSDGDEVLLFSSCFLGCLSSSLICRLFFFHLALFLCRFPLANACFCLRCKGSMVCFIPRGAWNRSLLPYKIS
jgi:hypothetical protein